MATARAREKQPSESDEDQRSEEKGSEGDMTAASHGDGDVEELRDDEDGIDSAAKRDLPLSEDTAAAVTNAILLVKRRLLLGFGALLQDAANDIKQLAEGNFPPKVPKKRGPKPKVPGQQNGAAASQKKTKGKKKAGEEAGVVPPSPAPVIGPGVVAASPRWIASGSDLLEGSEDDQRDNNGRGTATLSEDEGGGEKHEDGENHGRKGKSGASRSLSFGTQLREEGRAAEVKRPQSVPSVKKKKGGKRMREEGGGGGGEIASVELAEVAVDGRKEAGVGLGLWGSMGGEVGGGSEGKKSKKKKKKVEV